MRKTSTLWISSLLCLTGSVQASAAAVSPLPTSLCADCAPKGLSAAQALQLENQVVVKNPFFLTPNLPVEFPSIAATRSELDQVNYTGGALPNAFERPWLMSAAQIDTYRWVYDEAKRTQSLELAPFTPNFTTSFYDHNEGFLWNSPDAPWNAVAKVWGRSKPFGVQTRGLPGSFGSRFQFETPPARVPTPGSGQPI
jgi:hypothetical protein